MGRSRNSEGSSVDMTPMIDVVFQLIIFFIVTINMADSKDESIRLEWGTHGQEVDTSSGSSPSAIIFDVSAKGRVSLNNRTLKREEIFNLISARVKRSGNTFQVWVRGDARAQHADIRKVMDTCTDAGVGRVSFVAVKEARTKPQKDFFEERKTGRNRR